MESPSQFQQRNPVTLTTIHHSCQTTQQHLWSQNRIENQLTRALIVQLTQPNNTTSYATVPLGDTDLLGFAIEFKLHQMTFTACLVPLAQSFAFYLWNVPSIPTMVSPASFHLTSQSSTFTVSLDLNDISHCENPPLDKWTDFIPPTPNHAHIPPLNTPLEKVKYAATAWHIPGIDYIYCTNPALRDDIITARNTLFIALAGFLSHLNSTSSLTTTSQACDPHTAYVVFQARFGNQIATSFSECTGAWKNIRVMHEIIAKTVNALDQNPSVDTIKKIITHILQNHQLPETILDQAVDTLCTQLFQWHSKVAHINTAITTPQQEELAPWHYVVTTATMASDTASIQKIHQQLAFICRNARPINNEGISLPRGNISTSIHTDTYTSDFSHHQTQTC